MHVTTLARRLGSVALAASLALGMAACSGDSSDADATSAEESSETSAEPTESTIETTDDSTDEPTDDGADSGSEEPGDAPEELSAAEFYPTVIGALQDAETFAFESTTGVGGQESTVTGEARWAGSGMEMKATSAGAQAMDLIMLGQVIYMRAPEMGLGEKWIKIDLGKEKGSLFGMLAKMTDPQAMFKAMETPKKLEVVGTEDVDGVATNHYRITMDPEDYMTAMGFPPEMSSFLPKELVTDMWVDADNLPRKFSQTVETPSPGGGKPVTTTTEGHYHDYGLDVEIEAPPASETTDAPGLPGAA